MNKEKSKRTHNDAGNSAPKKMKSVDSRAPGRTKEDLRDYLQRKWQNDNVTSPVKPRTPFSMKLDKFEAPKRFHMSRFQIYYDKFDRNFHIGLYLNSMALYTGNEPLLCKVFPSSFEEIASNWFHKLPKGIVKSWKGLAEMFVARFATNKLQLLRVDSLMALKIGEGENLRVYAKRYYESLAKTLPKSMEELMARIEKYARTEEDTLGTKASKQEKRNDSPKQSQESLPHRFISLPPMDIQALSLE
ncbi:uncharacterized protein LOC114271484 [Camellia sinensis]|uniref:uncharacterized protein LOC114271484 n=1 Tax=Camellia sinensis TaxID=4442 RepID=UPI001035B828|nr:uncharacterized protein LOC114271484 [Camellia sinensis]